MLIKLIPKHEKDKEAAKLCTEIVNYCINKMSHDTDALNYILGGNAMLFSGPFPNDMYAIRVICPKCGSSVTATKIQDFGPTIWESRCVCGAITEFEIRPARMTKKVEFKNEID